MSSKYACVNDFKFYSKHYCNNNTHQVSQSDTDETNFFETDTRLRLLAAFTRDRDWDRDYIELLYEIDSETETLQSRETRDWDRDFTT